MRAKLVIFPIKGKRWCFCRSVDASLEDATSSRVPSTLKQLWNKILSTKSSPQENVELVVDFVSNQMNRAWMGLEKAPQNSLKSKIHGLGLKLLARVRPSEIFLKSITKDVTLVEATYPQSLNARLVRRRLRHVALRGTEVHKKYLYGSAVLLPLSSAFMILPMPNVIFFWVLFRCYSHWRALQGSEKLLQLISNNLKGEISSDGNTKLILKPSRELEELIQVEEDGVSESSIICICKSYTLNSNDALKFRHNF